MQLGLTALQCLDDCHRSRHPCSVRAPKLPAIAIGESSIVREDIPSCLLYRWPVKQALSCPGLRKHSYQWTLKTL